MPMPKVGKSQWRKLDFSMKNSFEGLISEEDDDDEEEVTELKGQSVLTGNPQPPALLISQRRPCLVQLLCLASLATLA